MRPRSEIEWKQAVEENARRIGEEIAAHLPPRLGFALVVFEINKVHPLGAYASNANARDVAGMLRDMANRLERGEEMSPHASN